MKNSEVGGENRLYTEIFIAAERAAMAVPVKDLVEALEWTEAYGFTLRQRILRKEAPHSGFN